MRRSSGKSRLLAQHYVDLRAWSIHLDTANSVNEVARQIAHAHHFQKSPLRVGVGKHHSCAKFRAIFQNDATRATAMDVNLCHGGFSSNFRPQFTARISQCLSDGAHPAYYMPEESLQF